MISSSDPSLVSFDAVKVAISPFESGLESCWGNNFELFPKLDLAADDSKRSSSPKKKQSESIVVVVVDDRKKNESIKFPIKKFLGTILPNSGVNKVNADLKKGSKEKVSSPNCLQFAVTLSLLLNRFIQALSSSGIAAKVKQIECGQLAGSFQKKGATCNGEGGDNLSFKLLIGSVLDQFSQNLQKLEQGLLKGKKADVDYFLGNFKFARVGGVPENLAEDEDDSIGNKEETDSSSPQKLANGLLEIPFPNAERLPQREKFSKTYPDKKKLCSVQDFFMYTESEGMQFFEELDRDGDGQVTLEDLEVAMRKRGLPPRYAQDFMQQTRSHLFSKSFRWKQFLSLMELKEPTILRAYMTLCLSEFGTLQMNEILTSFKKAGHPANEDNAAAILRFLNADTEGSISYGHFRNFMLLLPSDQLEDDPRNILFKAASVDIAPPVEILPGSVLKSALAGGLSCAFSAFLMHPVDTVKTQVQASTTLSLLELLSKLPQIGVRGLYLGSVPAILGQFSSHGLRTGICEASKLALANVAPTIPEIQVETFASFCSTVLGTASRIPCEVLKQRLQAGIYDNVGDAIVDTWRQEGAGGFFRGTGATLCREIPFYVAGMGLYAESKKIIQHLLKRELEPWESMVVGAVSGGLAAITTTPFDVIKTRMMITSHGPPASMSKMALSILYQEGPLALFKGAVPRFFWVAPLGAINLAGYDLLRKAMDKTMGTIDQLPQKRQTTG